MSDELWETMTESRRGELCSECEERLSMMLPPDADALVIIFPKDGRRGAAGLGATVGPARVLNVLKQVAERVAKRIGEIALSN